MLADLVRLQVELVGARGELALSALGGGWLNRVAPFAHDARAVMTLPGFLASERSLVRLNAFLRRLGYLAEPWGLGRNVGPRDQGWERHLDTIGQRLGERLRSLADSTSAPVSLIGQSLGGVYARDLATRLEPWIDRVIMLGSPTFHPYREERHNGVVAGVSRWLSRRSTAELAGREGLLHVDPDQPRLPFVAITSPVDGITDERSCSFPVYIVEQSGPDAPRENLRILCTHIGMSVSPWALLAMADRLARPRADWRPFDAAQYFPGALRGLSGVIYPPAGGSRTPALRRFIEASP